MFFFDITWATWGYDLYLYLQLVCFICRKVSKIPTSVADVSFSKLFDFLISISTTNEFEEVVLVVYNSSRFYWGCTPLCGDFFFCTFLQGQWRASAFSCALDVGRLDPIHPCELRVRWKVCEMVVSVLPLNSFVYVHQSILGEDLQFDNLCIFQLERWLAKLFCHLG